MTKVQTVIGNGVPERPKGTMTTKSTKPPWTDEEKFWRSARQSLLMFVDAIETYRLSERITIRTAELRKYLRSYQLAYASPPIVAESVRERIAELTAEKIIRLTTEAECDKL